MVRFLHSSDLHLAKPFGRFDELLRGRLHEARFSRIETLAETARRNDARLILLAGDTFDAQTPPPQVVRQAIRAFAAETDIHWIILPGNHDSLAATELWGRMCREKPENVTLALEPEILQFKDGVSVLPAPPQVRHPGRDLTEWMDTAETDPGTIRIGLAHGGVQDFGEEDALGIISPARAQAARLDYLALGDWHGKLSIGSKTWYSGTPESDSFKHDARATALIVDIAGPGLDPVVEPVETGFFEWMNPRLDVQPGEDVAAALENIFPPAERRRDALVEVQITGRLTLGEQSLLRCACTEAADDFGYFASDFSGLAMEYDVSDIDDIDAAGALRVAAESLRADGEDPDRDIAARRISQRALGRLYAYAQEERE